MHLLKKQTWKKMEKKVGGRREEGRGGRMDGRTNGRTERRGLESKKANYPARLLGYRERKWCELLKDVHPSTPSSSTVSCCALMSALFRQHVCCRHTPETNPLFTPSLPPSIPSSIPSIFVLRTSRLPGCWREPQVNKKTRGWGSAVKGVCGWEGGAFQMVQQMC